MEDWTDLVSLKNLTRELSLQDYVDEQICEAAIHDSPNITEIHQGLTIFVQQLKERTQPGDQWWEWIQGTEPMRQMGGPAVVRDGTIAWATMTWIS